MGKPLAEQQAGARRCAPHRLVTVRDQVHRTVRRPPTRGPGGHSREGLLPGPEVAGEVLPGHLVTEEQPVRAVAVQQGPGGAPRGIPRKSEVPRNLSKLR